MTSRGKLTLGFLISTCFLSTLVTTADSAEPPSRKPASATCKGNNCATSVCQQNGLQCCQCQNSATAKWMQVCQCCPPDHTCCSSSSSSSWACCPPGSKCSQNGTCVMTNTQSALTTEIGCTGCDSLNLSITADDLIDDVYIDGVSYTSSLTGLNTWTSVRSIWIPSTSRVIAVKCTNQALPLAGLLASVNYDFFMTDPVHWKCSSEFSTNWMQLTFDDSKWPLAVIAGINGDGDTHTIINGGPLVPINEKANWIWTQNFNGIIDSPVYCRGHLTEINGCSSNTSSCNVCRENSECCGCSVFSLGSVKACTCCPEGSYCCSSTNGNTKPLCCPRGLTCGKNGTCVEQILLSTIPSQTSCGSCSR